MYYRPERGWTLSLKYIQGEDEDEEDGGQGSWGSVGLGSPHSWTSGLCSAWMGSFRNGHEMAPKLQLFRNLLSQLLREVGAGEAGFLGVVRWARERAGTFSYLKSSLFQSFSSFGFSPGVPVGVQGSSPLFPLLPPTLESKASVE